MGNLFQAVGNAFSKVGVSLHSIFERSNMDTTIYILAVALAAAIVLLVVGLVGGILYYRCRLKDSHRTLARIIKENLLLREENKNHKTILQ